MEWMKPLCFFLAAICLSIFTSCAPSRTPFTPGGPTTVGMPEKLSDREREFVTEIDTALRREGLIPVKHGKGDLQLDFNMSSGPINIETSIALLEDEVTLFSADGKSGGIPLVGRENVARKSFEEAFAEFESRLARTAKNRGWSGRSSENLDSSHGSTEDKMPVY